MVDLLEPIPVDRREAATCVLAEVFGTKPVSALEAISGGASGARIYRVEVADRAYLLRLEASHGGPLHNVPRAYAGMSQAASAGVAPRLYHADASLGVAVMDFLIERPIVQFPGGPQNLLASLGDLIARVHEIQPPFAPPRVDYPMLVEYMLGALNSSGVFSDGLLARHLEGLSRIRAAYRPDETPGSSHNDPNPRNIIFDGERLWLIDWELAFRNDPMIDIAIVANDFAQTQAFADVLLGHCVRREPDARLRARLVLARQLVRAFYASIMIGAARFAGRPTSDDLEAPSPDEFLAAVTQGRLKTGSAQLAYTYGKMFLAAFRAGLDAPEFEDALATASSS